MIVSVIRKLVEGICLRAGLARIHRNGYATQGSIYLFDIDGLRPTVRLVMVLVLEMVRRRSFMLLKIVPNILNVLLTREFNFHCVHITLTNFAFHVSVTLLLDS